MAPSLKRATSARCRAFQWGRSWASRLLDLGGSERAQVDNHGAGTNGRQQLARIFGQQKNAGELGGSSRTLSSELAASFMKAELVKM